MSPLIILSLYIAFRAKQLVCDYLLQTYWIATTKGEENRAGVKALCIHSFFHGLGTLVVFLFFAPALWWFCIIDFFVHGLIDYIKSVVTRRYGWTMTDDFFWWSIGIDQEAHNLTHLAYLLIIIAYSGGIV